MKKFFMFAAMASVALVSCVKNETAVSFDEQEEIAFGTPVLSPNLKSTNELQNNFPTDVHIGVWAHYFDKTVDGGIYNGFGNGEIYMGSAQGGLEIEYNADLKAWKNKTNNYYWPKNGSLTFSAYAPYNASNAQKTSVTKDGIQIAGYKVSDKPAEQEDLLFSERVYNQIANPATTDTYPYEGVILDFKHALSSIVFKVKAADNYSSTVLTLKSIELLNVKSIGTFNQSLPDANGALTPAYDEDDATTALWSDLQVPTTYLVDLYNGPIVLDPTKATYTYNHSANASEAAGGRKATDLILLPQSLADCTLKITFDLKNDQMSKSIEQVLTKELATTTVDEWVRGKRYTYTVSVALDEIYFEPSVTNWEENADPALPTYDQHQ